MTGTPAAAAELSNNEERRSTQPHEKASNPLDTRPAPRRAFSLYWLGEDRRAHSGRRLWARAHRLGHCLRRKRLRELVREHGVKQIVVGLPLRLDGARGEMAGEAERFANRVRKQIGVPVELVDERLTSWEAERILEEEFGRTLRDDAAERGKKKPAKIGVDAVAAAVILREYLERCAAAKESA